MKAIITAGGRGTRMRPLTFSTNKHLIPLANKPLLFYPIEEVVAAGIKEIGINYNPGQKQELEAVLDNGNHWGVKFTYLLQEKPAGLANIIQIAKDFVGKEKFLMHLGDNIFYGGIKTMTDSFLSDNFNGLVPILRHKENWRLGVPYFDKKGKMIKYVEKPKNPPNDWAIPGLYFFDHHVFECFSGKDAIKPSPRGELEISSPYQWLLDHGYRVGTSEFKGIWKDPGKFDDWIETNQFLLDRELVENCDSKLKTGVKVEGRVKIGKKCQIENSILRGPIIIGNEVIIKDSFIGPYTSVADGCEIVNTKIENAILGKLVKVRNLTKPIDSSMVGEESVIEGDHQLSGATQLFIGSQCLLRL